MIVLPKETENKVVSIDKQLEKLYQMKNIMLSSHSTVNTDYAVEMLTMRIKELEQLVKDKDLMNSVKETELFDTEKYAEKAKAKK